MKKYDVIIIGSGLGGLECGYILTKKGYNVCILEKNPQIGGCLQTFKRKGVTFDTGFHYVGGLDEGQPLHTLFSYFDLLDLPWHKMDEDCFAQVVIEGRSFSLASGYDRFVDTLAVDFPRQRRQLQDYTGFLQKVGENIKRKFDSSASADDPSASWFQSSAYDFLQNTITDPLLRDVLAGSSMTMELCRESLPLYVYAQINNSFIQSSWRLQGGGALIADRLAGNIRKMGGTIITKAEVTNLIEEQGRLAYVEYNGEERIEGKHIISNLHPALTLSLIQESSYMRPIYRRRINNLANTFGMFTTHLKLKQDAVPYQNRNIFMYTDRSLWNCGYQPGNGADKALISFQVPESGKYTTNIDILTPMHWQEVEKWGDASIGRRGAGYEALKAQKAEECIALAVKIVPELKDNIEQVYTSTPLTYHDYTGTWQGSAYGIRKDYNNILMTLLAPQMPVPNLLLTGQNLNLHGVLGVTMTSFFTCAGITGMESLAKDLKFK